jgi:hypothetical protein
MEATIKTGLTTAVPKRTELKKLSVDTTEQEKAIMKNTIVIGIQTFEGNPFDGHTLSRSIE